MSSSTAELGHEEEHFHMPPPSIWPFLAGTLLVFIPLGLVQMGHGNPGLGAALFGAGAVLSIIAGIGWVTSIINEKADLDIFVAAKDLSMSWKLFLLSEAAIFGSFFGHYFYYRWHVEGHWPPPGVPHFHLLIPVMGTLMLVTSSFTCELAHKALVVGRRGLCKNWMIVTMLLGIVFLGLQAYEWGYLGAYDQFSLSNNVFATCFYMITGFHGFHVITGLLMLMLVYARMEMGSFDRSRHFSMLAASWYWHFVDVIWIVVLCSIYLL